MKKSTRALKIVLTVIISAMFLFAGYAKLTHNPMELAMFNAVNLGSTLMAIGIIEVLIGIMVWWKKTRTLALLLATATMGAAFAEVISFGTPKEVVAPGIVLLLVWGLFAIDHSHCNCSTDACKKCAARNDTPTPTV